MRSLPRAPSLEQPWGAFADTVLHFDPPAGPQLDLRTLPGGAALAALASVGLERAFCIVSAQDPMGATQSTDANRVLTGRLRVDLERCGGRFTPVDACAPDSAHCEWSFAVAIGYEESVALARRYSQLAIFWFDGAAFWIAPACAAGPAVRLPLSGDGDRGMTS